MDFETAGLTELRLNAKAAIEAINSLAKRLEESNKRIAHHEAYVNELTGRIEGLQHEVTMMRAALYNAGVR